MWIVKSHLDAFKHGMALQHLGSRFSQCICYVYFSESAVFWNDTSPLASVFHGYVVVYHMLMTGCNSPTGASVAVLVLLQCLAQIQQWETPHFLKWTQRLKSLLTELVESDTCNSFAGSLARYRRAFLVLITGSGFVPALGSWVQCSIVITIIKTAILRCQERLCLASFEQKVVCLEESSVQAEREIWSAQKYVLSIEVPPKSQLGTQHQSGLLAGLGPHVQVCTLALLCPSTDCFLFNENISLCITI